MASETPVFSIPVGLSELQLYLYKSILNRDLDVINNQTDANAKTLSCIVTQLKHCCSHPYLFDGVEKEQTEKHQSLNPETTTTHHLIKNCGKFLTMDSLIPKIRDPNTQILICSHIQEMIEWFETYCNVRGLSFYTISSDEQHRMNTECDIVIHCTSNAGAFHRVIESFPNINSVLIYDTDCSIHDLQDQIIRTCEMQCVVQDGLSVYQLISIDTLEEELYAMPHKAELSVKELKTLIRYKANEILSCSTQSTLDKQPNIDDILNGNFYDDEKAADDDEECKIENEEKEFDESDQENDSENSDANEDGNSDGIESGSSDGNEHTNEESEVEVALPTTYTLRDILNHPENQGVILVFVLVFISMIVVPVVIVILLNKYLMTRILLDWTAQAKQNLTIVIGVAVAHCIGILYVCYAWSGEDRVPAHIMEQEKEIGERKKHDSDATDSANEKQALQSKPHLPQQNGLRQRKTQSKSL